jgi:hypothetical protein
MRVITADRLGRWTHGVGLLAFVGLAWAVFIPGGLFWSAVLTAAVIAAAIATVALVRSRSVPSLAQVIAVAEAEPVVAGTGFTSGAGLRRGGERKP